MDMIPRSSAWSGNSMKWHLDWTTGNLVYLLSNNCEIRTEVDKCHQDISGLPSGNPSGLAGQPRYSYMSQLAMFDIIIIIGLVFFGSQTGTPKNIEGQLWFQVQIFTNPEHPSPAGSGYSSRGTGSSVPFCLGKRGKRGKQTWLAGTSINIPYQWAFTWKTLWKIL